MLTIGQLTFSSPWVLAAFVAIPLIWWLLKITPPAPLRVAFPAVRLLFGLRTPEQTPAHMPWWLMLLRLVLAALAILALAHPLLNPGARLLDSGPLIIAVDDDWSAAARWKAREDTLTELVAEAERRNRAVMLVTTAQADDSVRQTTPSFLNVADARRQIQALKPKPWPADRRNAAAVLDRLNLGERAEVVWLSNGVAGDEEAFARALARYGPVRVLADSALELPIYLAAPKTDGPYLNLRVVRATKAGERQMWVRATGEDGQLIARERLRLVRGSATADVELNVPSEARNKIVRLDVEDERSAAATFLLDERWRRRPVGLVSGDAVESAQPLLSSLFYLERALDPFAEIRTGSLRELLDQDLAVLMVSDIGQIIGPERDKLVKWLDRGGVLVRFAGAKLALNVDDLAPVRLRGGGRTIGGAMAWARPAQLAPFGETSPFYGLSTPEDVRVQRQVLAEPSLDLADKVWARLVDGTPLVTSEVRGRGRLVLFHVTANPDWSNLPLSGLFVEMLRRIVSLSHGISTHGGNATLPPLAALDGFGKLGGPPPTAQSIKLADIATTRVSPAHPPGFYGPPDARRAVNLAPSISGFAAIESLPSGVERATYGRTQEVDLKPWLLLSALLLALIDIVASLWLRGSLATRRLGRAVIGAILLLSLAHPAVAQQATPPARTAVGPDKFALESSLETRLAFISIGVPEIDNMTRAGLVGLGDILTKRTAVEPAAPVAIDIERDEIAFFPLVYWVVDERQTALSKQAAAKIDQFLKTGGILVLDTRDQGTSTPILGGSGGSPAMNRLRQLLRLLDLPPLAVVPEDHVLARSFYLMSEFPGRWAGGKVWAERHGGGVNDGVSSIVIGSNDWTAAWAIGEDGRPLAPTVPGGERQREMAYRFGVNLVMYALTGNYKADQVHIPSILERLGQ
ncbi:MAG: DUF4159 domain-containing protein [Alphaproteobacteria bacterium]|nr:DUF4159 domain-containing protein [Alphaproteobacteria bacterium]